MRVKVDEMLSVLRTERDQLESAITSLERIEHGRQRESDPPGQSKKRGRPAGSKNKIKVLPPAA